MATRSDWRGAISFAGQSVFVAAFKGVARAKPPSFKMLAPTDQLPVKTRYVDTNGKVHEQAELGRGVEMGKQIFPLTDEQLEAVGKVGRSDIVDIEQFPLASTVPLDLSLETYVIVPDEKVPGSENSVQTLWNGLRQTKRAAIIKNWTPRAGSRPSTLAVHATATGLVANVIPYSHEVRIGNYGFEPKVDKKQGQMFEAALGIMEYDLGDFDIDRYRDDWLQRRQAVIDAAIAGKPVEVEVTESEAPDAAPDLMAALEGAIAKGKTKAKPAPKKAPAKPRRKAAA